MVLCARLINSNLSAETRPTNSLFSLVGDGFYTINQSSLSWRAWYSTSSSFNISLQVSDSFLRLSILFLKVKWDLNYSNYQCIKEPQICALTPFDNALDWSKWENIYSILVVHLVKFYMVKYDSLIILKFFPIDLRVLPETEILISNMDIHIRGLNPS